MPTAKVGKRLKEIMEYRNVSLTTLSLEIGVSKASVSDWIKTGRLSFEHLVGISICLNVSLDWLLLGIGKVDLHGPLHPSGEEREMISLLRECGGMQALTGFHKFIENLLHAQLGDAPVQQVLAHKMLDDMACPLCVIDQQGLICDANYQCLSMLELNSPERTGFIGDNIKKWICPEYLLQAMEYIKKSAMGGVMSWMRCQMFVNIPFQNTIPVRMLAKSRVYSGEIFVDCLLLPE